MAQIDLQDIDRRCITDESRPWLSLAPHAERVAVKLLALDPVRDEVILVLRAPPGIELPRITTAGPIAIYTVQGRWQYRGQDRVAGPGSLVMEPALTCKTPFVLGDGTDDAIVLLLVTGDVNFLDDTGTLLGTENWRTALNRYHEHCRVHDVRPAELLTA